MNVKQLSVFVENKPGHLQNVLQKLGDAGINIITLTIADTSDFGVLRLIVNDAEKARSILKEQHITGSITDVLAIEIEDKPGSLGGAIGTFSKRDLNIEYMYAYTEKRGDRAVMIFRFDDVDAARKAIEEEGYKIVRKEDIIGE